MNSLLMDGKGYLSAFRMCFALDSSSNFHRGARRTLCSMDATDQAIDITVSSKEYISGKIARFILTDGKTVLKILITQSAVISIEKN